MSPFKDVGWVALSLLLASVPAWDIFVMVAFFHYELGYSVNLMGPVVVRRQRPHVWRSDLE